MLVVVSCASRNHAEDFVCLYLKLQNFCHSWFYNESAMQSTDVLHVGRCCCSLGFGYGFMILVFCVCNHVYLQTMLAGVKLEVMVPSQETPDQGSISMPQSPPLSFVSCFMFKIIWILLRSSSWTFSNYEFFLWMHSCRFSNASHLLSSCQAW